MLRKILSTEDALIIHGAHGGHGSSDFIRMLNGYFGVARAQEILEEIFFKNGRGPEINHRNLYGIYTEFFSSYARNLGGNLC